MDQTIRKILELDAATEERLSGVRLQCRRKVQEARQQASAMTQAAKHQTRDTIIEMEEQARSEYEQKMPALRGDFDRRAEEMTAQFAGQHDDLLQTLFDETLREAEA